MALISDLRAAIRALAAAPGFTAVAVLTLASGLALAVVVMSVVYVYVFRALPYPAADRLYRVDYVAPNQLPPRGMEQLDWPSLDDVVELGMAWDLDVFVLLGSDYPISAPGAWISEGFVEGLGIHAALGRAFTVEDFRQGSPSVALISHELWRTRFGGSPDIIGTAFNAYVSDRPEEPELFTVVGVLPADFWHVNAYSDVFTPLKVPAYPYQVRLRRGVDPSVAAERIEGLVRQGLPAAPDNFRVTLTSLQDSYVGSLKPLLWAVTAAALLVLLVATSNVAVLVRVRAGKRQREWALRVALGATRWRASALPIGESVGIGVAATVVAFGIARAVLASVAPVVERSLEQRIPGGMETLSLEPPVVGVALLSAAVVTLALTGIAVGGVWRTAALGGIAGSARGTVDGAARSRAVLVAFEIGASLALLAGAGLMAQTAMRMLDVDFGVDTDRVVTAGLGLRFKSFPDATSQADFYERLSRELHDRGSREVALSEFWPLQEPRPRIVESGGHAVEAGRFVVSPEYFDVLRIPIRGGRTFGPQDRAGGELVAIASASLADRMWPNGSALGRPLTVHADNGLPLTVTVVGVAADTRQSHRDANLRDVYLPLSQHGSRFAFLYIREGWQPVSIDDLRSTVARIDAEVAVSAPRPLSASIEQERARPRLLAALLAVFAGLAAVLALIGMYGVIAYAARQRQREIAVRMALGADARAVIALFARDGVPILLGGLVTGTAGAIALGRLLQSQLFGVRPVEPQVLALAALAFGVSGLAAMLWPAWHAADLDPALLLKEE